MKWEQAQRQYHKMLIQKAFKYRIYPTKEQEEFFAIQFGGVRWIYNHFLNRRKEEYLKNKKSSTYYNDAKYLTELKQQDGYEWLNNIDSQALQQSLKHLDIAYDRYFNKVSNFPRFKKRYNNQSFKTTQNFGIENNKLYIPKLKTLIKIKQDRKLPVRHSSVSIYKTSSGKYYAIFMCEIKQKFLPKVKKRIGIDLGLKELVITSKGNIFQNNKLTKKFEKKLSHKQRKLSRKKKGSKNRNKARVEVAKIHEKITFKRLDYLHKISRKLINENQVIIAENLNVAGMLKNHRLAKAISDASWSELVRQLKYKSEWYGRTFYQIDRWFPSSKTCNKCNNIIDKLPLKIRSWKCLFCNNINDRDINAAKNILEKGILDLKDIEDKKKLEMSGSGIESDNKQKLGEALSSVKKKLKKSSKQDGSVKQEIS
jgi:putative transposase